LLGPIDYIAVGFIGNNFKGDILKELQKSIDSKIIRLVDLTFIIKDSTGDVAIAEIEDQHEDIKQVAEMIGFDDETPLMTESIPMPCPKRSRNLRQLKLNKVKGE
jgi:hypothetical protein